MNCKNYALLLCVCLFAPVATGGSSGTGTESSGSARGADEWSLNERLDARMQMQAQAKTENVQTDHSSLAVAIPNHDHSDPPYSIRGAENPELLLPTELFTSLLMRCFVRPVDFQTEYRRLIGERVPPDVIAAEDLWSTLEWTSRDYLSSLRTQVQLLSEFNSRERSPEDLGELENVLEGIQQRDCVLRLEALENSRAALGGKGLDRILYEAVAPFVEITVFPHLDDRANLEKVEGGCK